MQQPMAFTNPHAYSAMMETLSRDLVKYGSHPLDADLFKSILNFDFKNQIFAPGRPVHGVTGDDSLPSVW